MITPINNRIILLPSESAMRGSIFVPEKYRDATTACLVVAVGNKVNPLIKEGQFVLCENGTGNRNMTIDDTKKFWCLESNIYAIVINRKIHPIGRRVLIKRDIKDAYQNGVLIPESRRVQSLDGEIVRVGMTREHFKTIGLKPGMKIRLKEWEPHMTEVTLEDGSYGLIVNESDLLFSYERYTH